MVKNTTKKSGDMLRNNSKRREGKKIGSPQPVSTVEQVSMRSFPQKAPAEIVYPEAKSAAEPAAQKKT